MPHVHQREYAMNDTNRRPSSKGVTFPKRKTVARGAKYGGEPATAHDGKYEMTTGAQTALKGF
jgi:hypothetical protein